MVDAGQPAELVDRLCGYAELGIDRVILNVNFGCAQGEASLSDLEQRVDRLWQTLSTLDGAEDVSALAALLGAPVGE